MPSNDPWEMLNEQDAVIDELRQRVEELEGIVQASVMMIMAGDSLFSIREHLEAVLRPKEE